MESFRKFSVVALSFLVFGSMALGIFRAVHSKLFTVELVEIQSSIPDPPLEEEEILRFAAIPVGRVSLFQIDLKEVEHRLLQNDWIQEVRLQKRFPKVLAITVIYKEPVALFQTEKGDLSYVDQNGKTFGTVDLLHARDLPILSGFSIRNASLLKEAVDLVARWEDSDLNEVSQLSSVTWDPDKGFRLLVTYYFGGIYAESDGKPKGRAMINWGPMSASMNNLGSYDSRDSKMTRIFGVLKYLRDHSIVARQIWADTGKKIVVKTVHGS